MNTNFKAIGLTPLGFKPESAAPEVDALSTRPSELLRLLFVFIKRHLDLRYDLSVVITVSSVISGFHSVTCDVFQS